MKKKKNNPILKFLNKKISLWILLVMVIAVIGIYMFGRANANNSYDESNTDNQPVQEKIIHTITTKQAKPNVSYLEKVEEVNFYDVGIQKVITQRNVSQFPIINKAIPLTEKKAIIILNYHAKFGIDKPVKIKELSDNKYEVVVPKFSVNGIELDNDQPYELYDSSGEILSNSTENIDTGALVTQELSNKEQKSYLKKYTKDIKSSARKYYRSLFKSIDENYSVKVTFKSWW